MLNPRWQEDSTELREVFAKSGRLRLTQVFQPEVAEALLNAQRQVPFALRGHRATRVAWQQGQATGLDLQYWQHVIQTSAVQDPLQSRVLQAFARWLFDEGVSWLEELTGLRPAPPADGQLLATSYAKGSYLDPHNDYDGQRLVALVFGFTPKSLTLKQGGHLQFITLDSHDTGTAGVEVSLAPGFNTLDLFEVLDHPPIHQVTLVQEHVERRALTCWFYSPRSVS